jgi:hypothetical protein
MGESLDEVGVAASWLVIELRWPHQANARTLPEWLAQLAACLPHPIVLSVDPDAVTLESAAGWLGIPVACLREECHSPGFPGQLRGADGFWRLAHVSRWVQAVGAFAVPDSVLTLATAAASVNDQLQSRRFA